MSQVKSVNVDRIIKTEDTSKVNDMIAYHRNLKKRGVFSLNQQAKFVHSVNSNIKNYLKYEQYEKGTLNAYMQLMLIYLDQQLLDLDQLTERYQNPLTDFIIDCEDTRIYESKFANYYINSLINHGDDLLSADLYDLLDKCPFDGLKSFR